MTYASDRTAELNARAAEISALKPGDGVTVSIYTDADAYTVVKTTPTRIVARCDKATLAPEWKPEVIPGGFVGHCTNQSSQTYTYEPDANGELVTLTLRRWTDEEGNERRLWKRAGYATRQQGGSVTVGRHKFHDYNF